jgi:hypothetical protein
MRHRARKCYRQASVLIVLFLIGFALVRTIS